MRSGSIDGDRLTGSVVRRAPGLVLGDHPRFEARRAPPPEGDMTLTNEDLLTQETRQAVLTRATARDPRENRWGYFGEDDSLVASAGTFAWFPTREDLLEALVEAEPAVYVAPGEPAFESMRGGLARGPGEGARQEGPSRVPPRRGERGPPGRSPDRVVGDLGGARVGRERVRERSSAPGSASSSRTRTRTRTRRDVTSPRRSRPRSSRTSWSSSRNTGIERV